MTVDIFIPCFIDQVYPETAFNMIKILNKLDVDVNYNPEQTCCGKTAFDNGYWDMAKEVGEKFLNDFPNDRPIVSPTSTCVGMVRNNYGELFHNTGVHLEYKRVQRNLFEFSEFLVDQLKVTDVGSEFHAKVTYHDSCSALRDLGVKSQPRTLLENVNGLELVEMKDTDTCCGFGGSFSVKNEAISVAMAEQKVHNAIESGADYIASTDLSCLMNQQAYITKNKLKIKTIHLIDILAKSL
ncbi:MAG: Fe-S oxidoreductase [Bacteroidetes bacterium]|nr:Fe-S oxidoreductase [Bacteroidota bacterium]